MPNEIGLMHREELVETVLKDESSALKLNKAKVSTKEQAIKPKPQRRIKRRVTI